MLIDRDNGLRKLMAAVAKAKRQITVGVHAAEGAASHGQTTVADVATWNHFGTDRIPARPFLTNWFDANKATIETKLREAGERFVKGSPLDAELEKLALWAQGGVQAGMPGTPPPNAQSTIDRKGSATTLVNTGVLRSSVRGVVA